MKDFRIVASSGAVTVPGAIPPAFGWGCFALAMLHVVFFPVAYRNGFWIFDPDGLGIPTDFVNVWSAGKLALQGTPALAYDWDVQKAVQVAELGQTWTGVFAWHYPPPFLFVASLLAKLPYGVAYAGWALVSLVPYLVVMRAIVGRPIGWLAGLAFPVVLTNVLVGQNGFLTASLIGGFLLLLPTRPVLAGICLGLLSYKPQYGLLFPLALIVAGQWRAFASAGITTVVVAAASWLAFGTESWFAFVHWLPMWSQAFLTEGRAPWGKLQSIYALVRYCGGSEPLGWAFHWTLMGAVVLALIALWRSSARYALKAAGLATATLLVTPYLFLYDLMVMAVAIGFLVRLGLAHGFLRHELPALAIVAMLLMFFPLFAAPTGFAATLIVSALIARRCGVFDRVFAQGRVAATQG
jgi:hypothetical protein